MKLVADLHVHTVSSGHAYSTLEEYVARAKEIGLKAFAITDHGPSMPGAPHYYHFSNMRMIPRKIKGIRVFRGCEATIINKNGEIDIQDEQIKWGELDIVMAAFHPRCGYNNQGEEKNTEVLLKTMANPFVKVFAHPANPQFPVEVEATVAEAKKRGILLEINNSDSLSRPGCHDRALAFAKEVKRQDWRMIVGTDSHISSMLGDFRLALALAKEAGLSEKHLVNTSMSKIEKYLMIS